MAENSSTIESWTRRPALLETQGWISEVFSSENEALTKALQISLSDSSSTTENLSYLPPPPSIPFEPESSTMERGCIPNRISITRKISKRKPRASKRTPTTYINTDPANFRRLVQEVTGIRIPIKPAAGVETEWAGLGSGVGQPYQSCLPTLDTSAFLLERCGSTATDYSSFGQAADGSFFDFESLGFPTLESWGALELTRPPRT